MKKKTLVMVICIAVLSVMFGLMAFAAGNATSEYWFQDGGAWKIRDGSGNMIRDSWVCDDKNNSNRDSNWYLMNSNGIMYEGVINDNGHYYLLDPTHNGTYGMMISGVSSYTYNGVTLQLETAHNGYFGEIKNTGDIMRLGLNVTSVSTAGKPFLYTSQFKSGGSSNSNAGISMQEAAEKTEHLKLLKGTWRCVYHFRNDLLEPYEGTYSITVSGNTLKTKDGNTYSLTDVTGEMSYDSSVYQAVFRASNGETLAYSAVDGEPAVYLGDIEGDSYLVFMKK